MIQFKCNNCSKRTDLYDNVPDRSLKCTDCDDGLLVPCDDERVTNCLNNYRCYNSGLFSQCYKQYDLCEHIHEIDHSNDEDSFDHLNLPDYTMVHNTSLPVNVDKMADDHWTYIESVLKIHNVDSKIISIVGFYYVSEFIRGYTVGVDQQDYIASVITLHHIPYMDIILFHTRTAFEHGNKHAIEDGLR